MNNLKTPQDNTQALLNQSQNSFVIQPNSLNHDASFAYQQSAGFISPANNDYKTPFVESNLIISSNYEYQIPPPKTAQTTQFSMADQSSLQNQDNNKIRLIAAVIEREWQLKPDIIQKSDDVQSRRFSGAGDQISGKNRAVTAGGPTMNKLGRDMSNMRAAQKTQPDSQNLYIAARSQVHTSYGNHTNYNIQKNQSMPEITPELAATVVRDFLLPMFQNDGKKLIRKKRRDMISSPKTLKQSLKASEYQSDPLELTQLNQLLNEDIHDKKSKLGGTTSVFHELKLSEQLMNEIYGLRNDIDNLQIQKEEMQIFINRLQTGNNDLSHKINLYGKKYKTIKQRFVTVAQDLRNEKMLCKRLQNSMQEMNNLFKINEQQRKTISQCCNDTRIQNEKLNNRVIELKQLLAIVRMENNIMGDQLKLLHNSFSNIGDCEKIQNKCNFELSRGYELNEERINELNEIQVELSKALEENTEIRSIMRDLNANKKKLIEDKEKFLHFFKEKMNQMETELNESKTSKEQIKEEFTKLEKLLISVTNEREKLKIKIQKLKNRRAVDLDQKICKNCGKEYLQNENFNWSCRTHRSDWGGEMWWCCGKTKKEAPGCKYAKHETKDDEEEEKTHDQEDKSRIKQLKCICCKEAGHLAKDCMRDPNLRTNQNIQEELLRIDKYKEYKKLNADTFQNTTKLFEMLAREKMPVIYEETISSDNGMGSRLGDETATNKPVITQQQSHINSQNEQDDDDGDGLDLGTEKKKRKKRIYKETSFKGYGLMKFDDFNYNAFNQIVFQMSKKNNLDKSGNSPSFRAGAEQLRSNEDEDQDQVNEDHRKLSAPKLSDLNNNNDNKDFGSGSNVIEGEERHAGIQKGISFNKRLYSQDEVYQIKNYQTRDMYEDILDLKNMALIENMKQKNLIDIDAHYKTQLELLSKQKGKGAQSKRSGQTRSVARQSDDTSQLFSSFNKDNESPNQLAGGKQGNQSLANLNSLRVNSSRPKLSASSKKSIFFNNLPPEYRDMSTTQILNSPVGRAYQQVMKQEQEKGTLSDQDEQLVIKSNSSSNGPATGSANAANIQAAIAVGNGQNQIATQQIMNSAFELRVKNMNQVQQSKVQLQDVDIQQIQKERQSKKLQQITKNLKEADQVVIERSNTNPLNQMPNQIQVVSSGAGGEKKILVENLDKSLSPLKKNNSMIPGAQLESPLLQSPTFSGSGAGAGTGAVAAAGTGQEGKQSGRLQSRRTMEKKQSVQKSPASATSKQNQNSTPRKSKLQRLIEDKQKYTQIETMIKNAPSDPNQSQGGDQIRKTLSGGRKQSSASIHSNSKVIVNPQSIKKKIKSDSMSLNDTNSQALLNSTQLSKNNAPIEETKQQRVTPNIEVRQLSQTKTQLKDTQSTEQSLRELQKSSRKSSQQKPKVSISEGKQQNLGFNDLSKDALESQKQREDQKKKKSVNIDKSTTRQ
ncbi:ankyrin repeat domain containing protein [Stylonychia lemnae]|uniref:Ankyrin repeat domain containing protein n=1 Tax=Stylonychia lemnae TaxID=5949 RepID=A0A077ZU72_STYLE|nr:ankyrin repeat domain containing protein [Stylonychia lemnae]|eukprot:CDW73124.1 ankyrin repeat domain containing protein [Stylonychia lemnae]